MNVTDYSSSDVVGVVSSLPGLIWSFYLDYLVFYSADSWVGTFAYIFRVIATILFIPLLALTLLDLVSYGMARTLGIIDPEKPSKGPLSKASNPSLDPSRLHAYFAGEESNMKLAGGHDLSPVVSRASSPTLSRRTLHVESTLLEDAAEEEVDGLRKRQVQAA